jgi:ribonucleoside-diphosphate reductase alpha chain
MVLETHLKGITTYVARGDRANILSKDGANIKKEQVQLFPASLKRPVACNGTTYKIPYSPESSLYVTINQNDEINKKLFEVFIECKDGKGKPWDAVTSRILSALFRRLPDSELEFLISELKEIKDPESGVWFGDSYVHSPSHAVAIALEMFMGRRDTAKKDSQGKEMLTECPNCHERGVVREDGCETCKLCGWNKCEKS